MTDATGETAARTRRPLDGLATLILGLAGLALVAMALVQAWQVFARYVLNDSPGWTEPVALLLILGLLFMTFGNVRDALLVFTGASQFAAVAVVGAGGSTPAALGGALLLAARNGAYGDESAPDRHGAAGRNALR